MNSSSNDKLLALVVLGIFIIYLSWRQLTLLELNVKLIEQSCFNIDSNRTSQTVNIFAIQRTNIPDESYADIRCVKSVRNIVSTFLCVYNESEDIYISRAILSNRLFEPDVMDVFISFAHQHQDWIVLDVGANIGVS